MDDDQLRAFRGANPVNLTEEQVEALCAGLVGVVVLLWCAWVVLHAYKNWSTGRTGVADAGGQVLRAVLLMVVVLAVVTWA